MAGTERALRYLPRRCPEVGIFGPSPGPSVSMLQTLDLENIHSNAIRSKLAISPSERHCNTHIIKFLSTIAVHA